MRLARGAAVVACALAVSCGSSAKPTQSPAPAIVVRESPGPDDVIQTSAERPAGHFRVRALSARCGIAAISGTHAVFEPERPFCRVRLRLLNADATFHTFDTSLQRLILADGSPVSPASDGMRIKRQPDSVNVGAQDVVELDLWFEPPLRARVTAVRVTADNDNDPEGSTVLHAAPRIIDLPLTGLR